MTVVPPEAHSDCQGPPCYPSAVFFKAWALGDEAKVLASEAVKMHKRPTEQASETIEMHNKHSTSQRLIPNTSG